MAAQSSSSGRHSRSQRYVDYDTASLIPPEHAEIHEQLVNWGRWCKVGRPPARRSESLEGNYRAPNGAEAEWETATPPPSPLPAPVMLEAVEVELIWRKIPRIERTLLKLKYVKNFDATFICKRLHINYLAWADTYHRARQMAKNLLSQSTGTRPGFL